MGQYPCWALGSISLYQVLHNPDEKIKLWFFLPGRHSSVVETAQSAVFRLEVTTSGIWLALGDSEEVAAALSQALRNCIQRKVFGLSYMRFGDVFSKYCPSQSDKIFSDADWARCPDTHRSTTGWCMFLSDAIISWRCKKQNRVSKSSTEAEYRAMSTACFEIVWLRGLLEELGFPQTNSTPLYADNTSAIRIATNPVFYERSKHIEIDCHSIRDTLESRVISLPYISSNLQVADVFTKAMTRQRHQFLVVKLLLVDLTASI